jgi:hypothetical protein
MARLLRALMFIALIFIAKPAFAGGPCPSGLPVTGNNCYFVAANGSDTNLGTSESSPWQHAPGMRNCVSNCLAKANGTGSYTAPAAGEGFIFRGGDTWHFGNANAAPYTGGTWVWGGSGGIWNGTSANCDTSDNPSAVRTSCIYIGVDMNWFSGTSWARPIMTDDNPTSTAAVSSCPFPNVGGFLGGYNETLVLAGVTFVQVDNFEWIGQCNASSSQGGNVYIHERVPNSVLAQNIYSNNYLHGFTHLPFNCPATLCEANEAFTVSIGSTIGPGNVCDGWDSDPTSITCLTPGGGGWLTYGNVFANQAQMVANGCHVWHDNYWFGYSFSGDGVAHGNQIECNNSAPLAKDSNGHFPPTSTHNLFYNNVLGHNTAGTGGDIKLQLAVNSTYPYYVFNNVMYDQGSGNVLNWGGTGITLPTGQQFFFNNTLDLPVGNPASCYTGMTYQNNHIIIEGGVGITGGNGGCTQAKNIVMSHAQAVSQGYMAKGTGTSGSNNNVTCASDSTPCAPTSAGNRTINAGVDVQSNCTALLASNDPTVQLAGAACQKGTTNSCMYITSTRSVTCPRVTPVARPETWDVGASQYGFSQTQNPQPPSNLKAAVQ